jgi:hypothetical protein
MRLLDSLLSYLGQCLFFDPKGPTPLPKAPRESPLAILATSFTWPLGVRDGVTVALMNTPHPADRISDAA